MCCQLILFDYENKQNKKINNSYLIILVYIAILIHLNWLEVQFIAFIELNIKTKSLVNLNVCTKSNFRKFWMFFLDYIVD